jgi:hypothetical protein
MRKITCYLIIIFLIMGCAIPGPTPIKSSGHKPLQYISQQVGSSSNAEIKGATKLMAVPKIEIPATTNTLTVTPSNVAKVFIKAPDLLPIYQISADDGSTNRLVFSYITSFPLCC